MQQILVGDVLKRAAFFLNDVNRAYFTDDILMPPFLAAYDDLRDDLMDYNIPIDNVTSSEFVIETTMRDIGGPTGPPLPVDLMEILEMYERTYGTNEDYTLMERRQFLPLITTLTNDLQFYSWQEQYVHFLGATSVREVKMNYVGDKLTIATNENSVINLFDAKSFLSYRTAALAAQFLGEDADKASMLNANASRSRETLLNLSVKNQQSTPARRRPFMASWKRSGGFYG
jgi:hypothetical protein